VGLTVRREILNNRRSLRVDFGWNWLTDDAGELIDHSVYVMVTNTGRRDITVMHAGLGWPAEIIDDGSESGRREFAGHRVEFVFDDPIHLKVDGPPVKIDASGGSLSHLFNPFVTPVQPQAFSGGGNEVRLGEWTEFIRNVPQNLTDDALIRGYERLRAEAEPPRSSGNTGLSAVRGYIRGSADDYRATVARRPGLQQDGGNSRSDGSGEMVSEYDAPSGEP
jgi:hypothetical protein